MKYREEDIARQLHSELVDRFGELSPTVEGAGVHWHCSVVRHVRECQVHCHTCRDDCEFYTYYKLGSETVAYSRIPSSHNTIKAVADWLFGIDLAEMYCRYSFIDEKRRALEWIRDEAIAAEPELQRTSVAELIRHAGDICTLLFRGSGRSCKVSFYGKGKWPDAKFSWDECQLFQYQPKDTAQFAAVLKAWICDWLMPSAMRSEFPWLTIGELADYYEAGSPVEGEFIKSWDGMEEFYEDTRCPFSAEVKHFMCAMRDKGYDRTLRAGQSLWSLILSRSRRHGMRGDQPSVVFQFHENGMIVVDRLENHRKGAKSQSLQIALTPEIEALLERLESKPVD